MKFFAKALLAATLMMGATGASTAFERRAPIPLEDIAWQAFPSGIKLAVVWGNRTTGPYGMFVRFPPGAKSPLHAHTNEYTSIIVQGIWEHFYVENYNSAEGGHRAMPGTVSYQAGGEGHADGCAKDSPVDCVAYVTQDEFGDVLPYKP